MPVILSSKIASHVQWILGLRMCQDDETQVQELLVRNGMSTVNPERLASIIFSILLTGPLLTSFKFNVFY